MQSARGAMGMPAAHFGTTAGLLTSGRHTLHLSTSVGCMGCTGCTHTLHAGLIKRTPCGALALKTDLILPCVCAAGAAMGVPGRLAFVHYGKLYEALASSLVDEPHTLLAYTLIHGCRSFQVGACHAMVIAKSVPTNPASNAMQQLVLSHTHVKLLRGRCCQ